MKVLVIAPHMDDEALGCGGVICKHKYAGDNLTVIFVADRVYNHVKSKRAIEVEKGHALKAKLVLKYDKAVFLGLPDERLDASVQDIIIPLERQLKKIMPEIVYLPFRGDNHQDHRAVFDAARVALRPAANPGIKSIYMYEIPSSTEQSPPLLENAFMPNHYVDITGFIGKKVDALSCYETEHRVFPHPRSAESVKILGRKRGSEAGFSYAESFMILRNIWK